MHAAEAVTRSSGAKTAISIEDRTSYCYGDLHRTAFHQKKIKICGTFNNLAVGSDITMQRNVIREEALNRKLNLSWAFRRRMHRNLATRSCMRLRTMQACVSKLDCNYMRVLWSQGHCSFRLRSTSSEKFNEPGGMSSALSPMTAHCASRETNGSPSWLFRG